MLVGNLEYTPIVECDDVKDVHELPLVLVDSLHLEIDCRVTGSCSRSPNGRIFGRFTDLGLDIYVRSDQKLYLDII
jgi:hypothetical protein